MAWHALLCFSGGAEALGEGEGEAARGLSRRLAPLDARSVESLR